MKNTRKKMLLSSVAMLLVALVALGSATYAWFSVSKTVKADQMVVKAIATAGLEISNTGAEGTYDTQVHFGQSESSGAYDLKPITWNTNASSSGFIPAGNVASPGGAYTGSYKAAAAPTPTAAATGVAMGTNDYFAIYKVWVRSAANGTTRTAHNVKAKVTIAGDNARFCRCRFIDETTSGNSKTFATYSGNKSCVAAAAGTKTSYAVSTHNTQVTATDTDTTAVGKEYTLLVWFDGEDASCKDSNKDKFANITIEFEAIDM